MGLKGWRIVRGGRDFLVRRAAGTDVFARCGWARDAGEMRIIVMECCFMYARVNPQMEGKYRSLAIAARVHTGGALSATPSISSLACAKIGVRS
ncbi:hypothetical protein X777_02533 [Ooceraea biroi]|uniref:Uncharacterized protein n=1 Tax=Ooceraea biroi TaxID=2015173 RepID=A0A026WMI0_OOCBI|nr:hypothetical protein X777_02533 [Ooceraea biroi]